MKYVIMFFIMFWLHLIDDFHLQGFLGDLKQKAWWKKNYPDKLYEHDWMFALLNTLFLGPSQHISRFWHYLFILIAQAGVMTV